MKDLQVILMVLPAFFYIIEISPKFLLHKICVKK